jgi:hypothetical protein
MIEQLIQAAQQQFAPQLQQLGVKPEQVSGIFSTTGESVTDGLKNHAMGGGIDTIFSLFNGQGNAQSSSLVSSISNGVVESLVSKVGLDPSVASKITGMIVPFVMEKFSGPETGSASSPSDLISKLGFGDLSGTLGNLLGGNDKGGDLLGGLGKLF